MTRERVPDSPDPNGSPLVIVGLVYTLLVFIVGALLGFAAAVSMGVR